MRTWNANFASVGRRFTKTLASFATLLLLSAGYALALPPAEEGGEAALKLPDLSSVSFLGVDGHRLLMIGLLFCVFGLGFGMAQRTNVIASIVPKNEIGVASSILALARNIAGAFGIALFGTILDNVTNANVLNIAQRSVLNVKNALNMEQFTGLIILKAQVSAYATVFEIASLVLLFGAFASLSIIVHQKNKPEEVIMIE